ncbi:MAG: hypothetical protein M3Y30_01775 [Gemmatimonadota bacterium]|nr:hypothetical protein [Gemmatimonadota bacterium]
MSHTPRHTAIALLSVLSFTLVTCSRGEKAAPGGNAGASQSASVPKVQTNRTPCDWISRADAEKALGEPLISDPVRVHGADNATPQADGSACAYEMKTTSEAIRRFVGIELALDDAGAIQTGFSGVPDLQAEFKDKESKGDSLVDGRWDYVSGVPGGLTMAREGRITVQIFAWGEMEKGMALASAIVDKIPDLPFAEDAADPNAEPHDPNPCSLITRQEAEAVIGPLKMPPYRSRESSSLAHGNGSSCSYFTGKHRVFVITPTYSGGATQFKMMSGMGNLMSSVMGGAKAPDTLDGKWDQITTSPTGALVFLKGDQMVEMQFKSSPTDYNGAAKLAQAAATRL